MEEFLRWFEAVPDPLVYAGLAGGAALENIVPAIPADTFVALGGVLSVVGDIDWRGVFFATWLCNSASAMALYRIGFKRGPAFFRRGWGRRLMAPRQLRRMREFYSRYGIPAIFFTRFLPGLRAVVPVFAGVSRQKPLAVALPILLASGIWYGLLVAMGVWAGDNLQALADLLGRLNRVLLAAAVLTAAGAATWWWRSRGGELPARRDEPGDGEGESATASE